MPGQKGRPIPQKMKQGMEQMFGADLGNVRVHYNSPKPATVQAHAYAQGGDVLFGGKDIHLGQGQQHLLAHELTHVVQQMQGGVRPRVQKAAAMGPEHVAKHFPYKDSLED